MIHSAIEGDSKDDSTGDSTAATCVSATHRGAPLPRTFRGLRAEDMMGAFADAIDYKFLEAVLGCRGRKVPKDIGI
jgi:hypothetical protein